MSDYSKFTDAEIRFKIAYLKGFADLGMPPNYPTDIKAAWELVEEMRAADSTEVYLDAMYNHYGVHVFDNTQSGDEQENVLDLLAEAHADTAPMQSAWHICNLSNLVVRYRCLGEYFGTFCFQPPVCTILYCAQSAPFVWTCVPLFT